MIIKNNFPKGEPFFKGTDVYVADFETSAVDESQNEVFVYATGLMKVDDEKDTLYYNNNIEDFIDNLYNLPALNNIIYFHNLTFDVEFILNYLVNNKGFKQLRNEYTEKNNKKVLKNKKEYSHENLPSENTFEIIFANGSFYQVILYLNSVEEVNASRHKKVNFKKIILKDSYKICAFPLKKIAKEFLNYNMPKDGIDHTIIRKRKYILNTKEMKYLYDDVKVLKDFVYLILFEGIKVNDKFRVYLDKLTIAGQALYTYKSLLWGSYRDGSFNKCKAFKECFKNACLKGNKESSYNNDQIFNSVFPQLDFEVDSFIRRSYFGGIVYKNGDLANKENLHGMVYDVNSLYPYVMHDKFLPYGNPIYFEGEYKKSNIPKKKYPLYIQEIEVKKFTIKEGFIPNVQIRGSAHFSSTVYQKSNKYFDGEKEKYETITFVFTNVQLDRFLKSYNVEGLTYKKGFAFQGSYGLFNNYIDTFMTMKKEGEGAVRATAKLFLNSLYGKFGTNPVKEERIIDYDDGVFSSSCTENGEILSYLDKNIYLPLACFITAYAREVLLTAVEKVHDRFLYCDTDSIHILGYDTPDIPIDDKELGYWKLEGKFTEAKYIGAKRYAEKIDGKWDIKCCGLSKDIMGKLEIEVFENCEYTGKEVNKLINTFFKTDDIYYYKDKECTERVKGLVRSKKKKYVKGGIIIKEQPYMINDKQIIFM